MIGADPGDFVSPFLPSLTNATSSGKRGHGRRKQKSIAGSDAAMSGLGEQVPCKREQARTFLSAPGKDIYLPNG